MAIDDKCPQWIRLDTHDVDSREVSYILGGYSEADLANYGRLCILRQEIVRAGEGYLEVGDDRHRLALGHKLGIRSDDEFLAFIEILLESGVCERAAYEAKGWLMMPDAWNQLSAYQSQVRANRANGAKGGRPRKAQSAAAQTEEKPSENPTETEEKPNQNPSKTEPEPNQNPDITQPKPEPSIREEKINLRDTVDVTGQSGFSTSPNPSTEFSTSPPLEDVRDGPAMRHASRAMRR